MKSSVPLYVSNLWVILGTVFKKVPAGEWFVWVPEAGERWEDPSPPAPVRLRSVASLLGKGEFQKRGREDWAA